MTVRRLGSVLAVLACSCAKRTPSHDGKPIDAWIRQLADRDGIARARAELTVKSVFGDAAFPFLERAAQGDDLRLAAAAAVNLWYLTRDEDTQRAPGIDHLAERAETLFVEYVLTSPGSPFVLIATEALSAYGTAKSVRPLMDGLKSPSADTRLHACSALGWLGPHAAVAEGAVLKLIEDHDLTWRWMTLWTLRRIEAKSPETARAAGKALVDPDDMVRLQALRLLVAMGQEARPASELIEAAIRSWQARGSDDDAGDLREILEDLASQGGR